LAREGDEPLGELFGCPGDASDGPWELFIEPSSPSGGGGSSDESLRRPGLPLYERCLPSDRRRDDAFDMEPTPDDDLRELGLDLDLYHH
jgi:hypothetical protein